MSKSTRLYLGLIPMQKFTRNSTINRLGLTPEQNWPKMVNKTNARNRMCIVRLMAAPPLATSWWWCDLVYFGQLLCRFRAHGFWCFWVIFVWASTPDIFSFQLINISKAKMYKLRLMPKQILTNSWSKKAQVLSLKKRKRKLQKPRAGDRPRNQPKHTKTLSMS